MIGYVANIAETTAQNTDFRRVLYSGAKLQLVLMALNPSEELGGEIHDETDQFFHVEQGKGLIVIDGTPHKITVGDCAVVPAGAHHNLICTGHAPLKVYALYGPPHHLGNLVQQSKAQAAGSDEAFDGNATEHAAKPVQV